MKFKTLVDGRSVEQVADDAAREIFILKMMICEELKKRDELTYQSSQATKWLAECIEVLGKADVLCSILNVEYANALKEADDES